MMAHPLSTPLDAAEMFTARGWVVFPCDHPDAGTHCTGTARACRERRCKAERDPAQRGKHPRVKWGDIVAPVDSVTLRRWFGRDTVPANVAIACGPSGLVIVDEDHAERGGLAGAAASVGQPCPDTFTVSTHAGRRHYYFAAPVDPDTGERWRIGNAPGGLARFGCDVRGGASGSAEAGGYVITAGSTHASGEIYTAAEAYAQVVELPRWLIGMMLTGPPATAEGVSSRTGTGSGGEAPARDSTGGTLRASDGARWDDAPRYGSAEDLCAQFQRHCDDVEHEGGAFRHELFLAARDGWRLVHLGLLDEDRMQRALEACVWRVWQAEPDDNDLKIFWEEALPAAQRSPWELSGPHRGAPVHLAGRTFLRSSEAALTSENEPADRTTHGNSSVAGVTDGEQAVEIIPPVPAGVDPAAWRTAYRRRTADEAVREYLAAKGRGVVVEDDLDAWLDEPDGGYLVEGMLYRDGLAVIFGAPGMAKSFLALDIALSLVTGVAWRHEKLTGRDGGLGTVHYVMAEGRKHNRRRTLAWLAHHGRTREDIRGRFFPFPQGVMLTEAGIASYLERVRLHKPDLIILDTKNLMFAGRENAGEDYGRMINVLHMIRRAADEVGCAVVLIDHSGLGDDSRVRGSNAQLGGIDTEIMVEKGDEGLRIAHVTRDKGAPEGDFAEWCFRLAQVDTVERPKGMAAPAVCIPSERDRPFADDRPWWVHELPEDIPAHELVKGSPPAVRKCCADLMRLLRSIGDLEGAHTTGQLVTMLNERKVPHDQRHRRATAHTAVKVLREAAMIESGLGSTTASPKWALAEAWTRQRRPR